MKQSDVSMKGKIMFGAIFFGLLLACTTTTPSRCSQTRTCDNDGDGYFLKTTGCFAKVYDCNDANPKAYPGAEEICDGLDNNCDGSMLPGEQTDADGDGFLACNDCNDNDPNVSPAAEEICDGVDDNCDGKLLSDEATDADGDGFATCMECNDADAAVNPGAAEVCDGKDDNCDGVLFPGEDVDADGDGFLACNDCNDSDAAVNKGAAEICNGIDDNCDGVLLAGEAVDADGDGVLGCNDCNDADALVKPGAEEICNGVDDNCDGALMAGEDTDADGDGLLACNDCNDNGSVCATIPGPPGSWKVQVLLQESEAGFSSDFYIAEPGGEMMLIPDCHNNVGMVASTDVRSGSVVTFFLRVHNDYNGSTYDHYTDSEFSVVTQIDAHSFTIGFEDLPADDADWDFNDAMVRIEFLPVTP
jgi:hypothetical protein